MDIALRLAEELQIEDVHLPTRIVSHDETSALILELERIEQLFNTMNKLKKEQERLSHQLHTFDLMDPGKLQKRFGVLTELCEELKMFCVHKSDILNQLKQPLTTSVVVIEQQHQECFIELVDSITGSLSTLSNTIDSLKWYENNPVTIDKLDDTSNQLLNILAKCQKYVDIQLKIRVLMQKYKIIKQL
ncbi:Ras and EF-hand domain-containing protein [Acrasis kona]|uniref:Ras and EF-hand domain-containing protein n=1 Tax=Acrasis kona TaxID=1008807 RepID=A0AAW2ZP26_9EUKA